MQGFLSAKFDAEIKGRADGIVNATIEVYERISKELLPTPARFVCYSGGCEGGGGTYSGRSLNCCNAWRCANLPTNRL